jgi:hypothetical protein
MLEAAERDADEDRESDEHAPVDALHETSLYGTYFPPQRQQLNLNKQNNKANFTLSLI